MFVFACINGRRIEKIAKPCGTVEDDIVKKFKGVLLMVKTLGNPFGFGVVQETCYIWYVEWLFLEIILIKNEMSRIN
jgi:hypothetical protein